MKLFFCVIIKSHEHVFLLINFINRFDLSPHDVIKFCTDCVLSEEEEPCDVPEGFYDELMP